jgi:hypothetical protein
MSNSIGTGFSPSATGKSGFTTGGLGNGAIPGVSIPLYALYELLQNYKGRSNRQKIDLKSRLESDLIKGVKAGELASRIELGGGLKGRMPQPLVDHDNTDQFARTRFTLRDAWNTTSYSGSSNISRIVTPFRAVNNAGDLLSRQNYSVGGACQSFQSRPGLYGLRQRFGANQDSPSSVVWSAIQINPAIPASTCNGKYVYDSSDYIRFRKNQAINQNYNDLSFGGNLYNGSQVASRAIKRY